MKLRLTPFSRLARRDDRIVLATPDLLLEVAPHAAEELARIQAGFSDASPYGRELFDAGAAVAFPPRPLETLLYAIQDYMSSEGLGLKVVRVTRERGQFDKHWHAYYASDGGHNLGYGWDESREPALLKAVVEAYERYSCTHLPNQELIETEAPFEPLPLADLVAYDPFQYRHPSFRFTAQPSGQWITVRQVGQHLRRTFPAELALLDYPTRNRCCGHASSNGVAAHTDRAQAFLRSAYEVIERDALMSHWFGRRQGQRITPPPTLHNRLGRMSALGFEVEFVNLTRELTPVIMAILRRNSDVSPRRALGISSQSDPAKAAGKALSEVEASVCFRNEPLSELDVEEIRHVHDHGRWYDQQRNWRYIDALIDCDLPAIPIEDLSRGPETVDGLRNLLTFHGRRWYVVELNSRGRERTGVVTVRSIIPGLVPITFGYLSEPLDLIRRRAEGEPVPRAEQHAYLPQPLA